MELLGSRNGGVKNYLFGWFDQVRGCLQGRKDLFCLILFLFFSAGCAGVKTEIQEIYSDRKVKVHLAAEREATGEIISKEYQHPWAVDTKTLESALRFIYYQKKGLFSRNNQKKVFPAPERKTLLAPLQEAFSKAGPDQLIEWAFIYPRSWTIFKKDYLTDGVLFRQGDKMHIVFRNIALEELFDYRNIAHEEMLDGEYDSFKGNPMKKPILTDWVLLPGKGQSLVKGEVKNSLLGPKAFTNWIVVDLSTLADTKGTSADETPEVIADKASEATPGAVDPPESLPLSKQEVEKRLQFLGELYQEGVLSSSAYEEKKKALERHYSTLPDLEGP